MITNQPQLVEKLLKAGADPRLVDNSGNTPLHIACKRGSVACFGVITQNGRRHLTSMLSFPNYNGTYPIKAHIKADIKASKEMLTRACLFSLQDTTASTWPPSTATSHWWRASSASAPTSTHR